MESLTHSAKNGEFATYWAPHICQGQMGTQKPQWSKWKNSSKEISPPMAGWTGEVFWQACRCLETPQGNLLDKVPISWSLEDTSEIHYQFPKNTLYQNSGSRPKKGYSTTDKASCLKLRNMAQAENYICSNLKLLSGYKMLSVRSGIGRDLLFHSARIQENISSEWGIRPWEGTGIF